MVEADVIGQKVQREVLGGCEERARNGQKATRSLNHACAKLLVCCGSHSQGYRSSPHCKMLDAVQVQDYSAAEMVPAKAECCREY